MAANQPQGEQEIDNSAHIWERFEQPAPAEQIHSPAQLWEMLDLRRPQIESGDHSSYDVSAAIDSTNDDVACTAPQLMAPEDKLDPAPALVKLLGTARSALVELTLSAERELLDAIEAGTREAAEGWARFDDCIKSSSGLALYPFCSYQRSDREGPGDIVCVIIELPYFLRIECPFIRDDRGWRPMGRYTVPGQQVETGPLGLLTVQEVWGGPEDAFITNDISIALAAAEQGGLEWRERQGRVAEYNKAMRRRVAMVTALLSPDAGGSDAGEFNSLSDPIQQALRFLVRRELVLFLELISRVFKIDFKKLLKENSD